MSFGCSFWIKLYWCTLDRSIDSSISCGWKIDWRWKRIGTMVIRDDHSDWDAGSKVTLKYQNSGENLLDMFGLKKEENDMSIPGDWMEVLPPRNSDRELALGPGLFFVPWKVWDKYWPRLINDVAMNEGICLVTTMILVLISVTMFRNIKLVKNGWISTWTNSAWFITFCLSHNISSSSLSLPLSLYSLMLRSSTRVSCKVITNWSEKQGHSYKESSTTCSSRRALSLTLFLTTS